MVNRQDKEVTIHEANIYFDMQEVQNVLRNASLSESDINQLISMRIAQGLEVIALKLEQMLKRMPK